MESQSCIDCHNHHPYSKKKDWKIGDVRGVLASSTMVYRTQGNLFYYIFSILVFLCFLVIIILLNKLKQLDISTQKAKTDALTNINNRYFINEDLTVLFEKLTTHTHYQGIAVMLLDVDNFKWVNDNYGHDVGDTCLKEIAKTINNIVRKNLDHAARWGGEEFFIMLSDTENDHTIKIANRILKEIRNKKITAKHLNLTVSIGICHISGVEQSNFERACKVADSALYTAKKKGKNQFILQHYTDGYANA